MLIRYVIKKIKVVYYMIREKNPISRIKYTSVQFSKNKFIFSKLPSLDE